MATNLPTLEGKQMEISDDSLAAIRMRLRGEALTPADPGYENASAPFNAMHIDRPNLVVRCTGTADVIDAVNLARDNGIELSVRGGGHSIAGFSSSNGGMVIDLSLMRGVDVDPEAKLARVQGGALLGDLDRETQVFGLATPSGRVSDTGIAGLTLGGGYGWLRRKHGLSCDNVVAAQVVCADGEVRTASADVNPDLFWAIRGGGGNFGIVTSFTLRLHPVGPIVGFAGVFYSLADAGAVLRGFREYAQGASDEVTPGAVLVASHMPANPSLPEPVHKQRCLIVAAVYAGESDEGMDALKPLRELATPLADISQPMPFTVLQTAFDGFFPRAQLHSYWKSVYLREFSDEAIDLMVERTQARPARRSPYEFVYVDILPMGGAVNRVAPGDTAFGERLAPWMVAVDGNWTDPADTDDNIAWVRQRWSELGTFGGAGTYLNFSGDPDDSTAGADDTRRRNLRRLAEVKATYDPDNFFRRNNNIRPAS